MICVSALAGAMTRKVEARRKKWLPCLPPCQCQPQYFNRSLRSEKETKLTALMEMERHMQESQLMILMHRELQQLQQQLLQLEPSPLRSLMNKSIQ